MKNRTFMGRTKPSLFCPSTSLGLATIEKKQTSKSPVFLGEDSCFETDWEWLFPDFNKIKRFSKIQDSCSHQNCTGLKITPAKKKNSCKAAGWSTKKFGLFSTPLGQKNVPKCFKFLYSESRYPNLNSELECFLIYRQVSYL